MENIKDPAVSRGVVAAVINDLQISVILLELPTQEEMKENAHACNHTKTNSHSRKHVAIDGH